MIVVGAGMAGLLAGAMLQDELTAIFEQQPSLPNNHSAVLRFRSSVVADSLNIPFKKVKVLRAVHPWRNAVADAMAYSRKTNGTGTLRSILDIADSVSQRYIAPSDFIFRMERRINHLGGRIVYNCDFDFKQSRPRGTPIISTVPMPLLMKKLSYEPVPNFRYVNGRNVIVTLTEDIDAYCSLYIPDPALPFARISLTGNELVAECYGEAKDGESEAIANKALEIMGLDMAFVKSINKRHQRYAKIVPIDEAARRKFMMWATDKHNIYSFGRFATWRPGLLLDDLVSDLRTIMRLSENSGEMHSHRVKI